MTDDRYFAPDARYGANSTPGVRWHDPRTGQEDFAREVSVEDLRDAGATVEDPDAVKLPARAYVGPYQPPEPEWIAEVSYARLDPKWDDDELVGVYTRRACESEVFDDRDDAVAFIAERIDGYDDAERRDARTRPNGDGIDEDDAAHYHLIEG
ncbi:hypothetical protein [Halorubrum tropicale]|uniref:Uncharacterized protein n=1 Tax=Halorubrum tropicale TaxID=1765655 RepID=A0A0M9AII5_9EURY|nr:hypothetical protein [Halorubrum tropicale]KOX92702.1 hypothetical protein AMR74_16875 [Halorubrum tropicale]